ncbi:MAG: hypothetical protein M3407_09465, partial [Acidobacteriota bacterium]|nr:hypothetical protein [Acidobacteriota bacterium]
MKTSFPRLFLSLAIFSLLVAPAAPVLAQNRLASSLSATPNAIDRDAPLVSVIIEKAEKHFKQGELNLADNRPEQARSEFDKAVDAVLESGMDVRANPRLQTYYLELVERVYRKEMPSVQLAATQQ